jgi:hypothetical protein
MRLSVITFISISAIAIFLYIIYLIYQKYQAHKKLCKNIRESLHAPVTSQKKPYDAFMASGLMLGEYLWQLYTIDTNVIKAVNFSSAESLDSNYAVSEYLMNNMIHHDSDAFLGFQNRLTGYIGEQRVAEILQQQNIQATWASTSNQEIWDLKINDELINVKTVLDIHSLKATALAHPNVTYVVPEDTYQDIGVSNIQPLEGFYHQEIHQSLDETYDKIDGSNAFDLFSTHLPVVSGIMALNERNRLLKVGGDPSSVNKNTVIDFGSKTAGSLAMVKIGSAIGIGLGSLAFMPVVGGIIGGVLGAFWGAKKGQQFGKKLKELDLEKQKLKLHQHLEDFGNQYLVYIPKIQGVISQPLIQQEKKMEQFQGSFINNLPQDRWYQAFFPNKNRIFYEELKKIAEVQYQKKKNLTHSSLNYLDQLQNNKDTKSLAVFILNNAHLRDFLYVDLMKVKRIYAQKDKVYYERYKLYPDHFPLTKRLKNYEKLYNHVHTNTT